MNPSFFFSEYRRARAFLKAVLLAAVCGVGLGGAPLAHAERADRDKPLNIEADNMTYDDLKQVNIFTGHVVATKGTIVIKADRVEVKQDPQGYQYATGTMTGHGLAYFRQKRDGVDEYVDGTAERIDYDGKQDLTALTTNATVRRLQGLSTVMYQVHGSVITYDGQPSYTVSIMEMKDGKVARETQYFGDAFEPGPSRAQWVERMQ